MKATTRNMAEAISQALGPIFHSNPDYKTICEAMALTMARVAQSTPDKGSEEKELDRMMEMADIALNKFLNEEEAIHEAKQSTLAKGIEAFAEMARSDGPAYPLAALHGDLGVKARDEAEAFAGQDHSEESWANSSIHQEVARFEQEHPNRDDGYNPDGPREYAP